jgi:hypothetical protein
MVMPNRNGGRSPDWDDLPPSVRSRFAGAPRAGAEPAAPACEPLAPRALALDLSRLALLFLCVALGNIAFLLLALWFIYG